MMGVEQSCGEKIMYSKKHIHFFFEYMIFSPHDCSTPIIFHKFHSLYYSTFDVEKPKTLLRGKTQSIQIYNLQFKKKILFIRISKKVLEKFNFIIRVSRYLLQKTEKKYMFKKLVLKKHTMVL